MRYLWPARLQLFSLDELTLEKVYYQTFLAANEKLPILLNQTPTIENINADINEYKITIENEEEEVRITSQPETDTSTMPACTGKHRGIEGGNNSCYLDSMLFCFFFCTNMFDFILDQKKKEKKFAKECRRILRDDIVIPLRRTKFCSYEKVMNLRIKLSTLNADFMGSFMGKKNPSTM